jgi:hypothetical protein
MTDLDCDQLDVALLGQPPHHLFDGVAGPVAAAVEYGYDAHRDISEHWVVGR